MLGSETMRVFHPSKTCSKNHHRGRGTHSKPLLQMSFVDTARVRTGVRQKVEATFGPNRGSVRPNSPPQMPGNVQMPMFETANPLRQACLIVGSRDMGTQACGRSPNNYPFASRQLCAWSHPCRVVQASAILEAPCQLREFRPVDSRAWQSHAGYLIGTWRYRAGLVSRSTRNKSVLRPQIRGRVPTICGRGPQAEDST
jgi:hypothetical protein